MQKVSGLNNSTKNLLPFISPTTFLYFIRKRNLENKYKGKKLKIGLYSSIRNSDLGNYVFIGEKVSIKNSFIGDHTYINSSSSVYCARIGKFSSIASNVTIGLSIHPSNLISTHPAFYSNNQLFKTYSDKVYFKESCDIIIGNDVWIGEGALILGEVNIGDGAIIAARSVLTKNVEPYEIVGGVPAKNIRYRFAPELRLKIIETRWWDKDEEWFLQNFKLFHDINSFRHYFNI